jgi:hypothetical protein
MEVLLINMCWCSVQVKTSGITCLYVEIIDPRCINFVNFENYASVVPRECRILVYRCLLEKLEIGGSI